MSSPACHSTGPVDAPEGQQRIALVGSPNAGKTSVFNHLTGMRARTGNYPGVTVTRSIGTGKHTCPNCGTVKFTVCVPFVVPAAIAVLVAICSPASSVPLLFQSIHAFK